MSQASERRVKEVGRTKILYSGMLHSYKEIFGFRVITVVNRTYTVQLWEFFLHTIGLTSIDYLSALCPARSTFQHARASSPACQVNVS